MPPEAASSSFAETRWTLVRRAEQGGEGAAVALAELCTLYHAPVERFVRKWCGDQDKARDLTQEFFLRLLQRQHLGAADEERGRFRSYLLGAVKHFLCDTVDRSQTRRRGGGVVHVSLGPVSEGLEPDERALHAGTLPDPSATPPDVEFDRQWALAVLCQALDSLEQQMVVEGRGSQFAVLKPWLAGADGPLVECSKALGMTDSAVRVALHRLRQRYRDTVRQQVAQTLDADAGVSVEEELRHLRAALQPGPDPL